MISWMLLFVFKFVKLPPAMLMLNFWLCCAASCVYTITIHQLWLYSCPVVSQGPDKLLFACSEICVYTDPATKRPTHNRVQDGSWPNHRNHFSFDLVENETQILMSVSVSFDQRLVSFIFTTHTAFTSFFPFRAKNPKFRHLFKFSEISLAVHSSQ